MRNKKTFTRVVSILLIVMMAAFMSAGCGSPKEDKADKSETQSKSSGEIKYKIGFLHTSFSDSLGENALRCVNKAADTLGVEVQTFEDGGNGDKQLSTVENMISSGVDGILICPASDAVIPKIAEVCEKNEVYLMVCFRQVLTEEIKEALKEYKYYLGNCYESETDTAAMITDIVAEENENVCMFVQAPGMVAVDERIESFKSQSAVDNMNILADYTIANISNPSEDITPGMDMFLNSYPEATAVFLPGTAAGMGEAAVASVKSNGKVGDVKLAGFDSFEGMDGAFDDGILCALATAHHADPFYSFMVLYNAMAGTPLSEEQVELHLNYMVLTDAETCSELKEYILNPEYDLYSSDEILQFTKAENPDFDIDALQKEMDQYTLENVVERIKNRNE